MGLRGLEVDQLIDCFAGGYHMTYSPYSIISPWELEVRKIEGTSVQRRICYIS